MEIVKDVYADMVVPPTFPKKDNPVVLDPGLGPYNYPERISFIDSSSILALLTLFAFIAMIVGIIMLKKSKK